MKQALVIVVSLACLGCVNGAITRTPSVERPVNNSIVVGMSRDVVWAKAIPQLGKTFFVINNLDKASGLVNVSYSGDPEKYVDGGIITSKVSGPQGEQTSTFPASRAYQHYLGTVRLNNGMMGIVSLDRKLSLDGRANIILEEIEPTKTRITVNIRYVLNKSVVMANQAHSQTLSNTMSMSTGAPATFPGENDLYRSTGVLEEDILSAFK